MYKAMVFAIAVLAFLIFNPLTAHAKSEAERDIEVFDALQGRVVAETEPSTSLQKDAAYFLQHMTDVYRKVSPIPNEGYLVRVPLEPPVEVNNEWISGLFDEVIIIYSTDEAPFLLVFDEDNRARFFNFKGDATSFLATVLRRAKQ